MADDGQLYSSSGSRAIVREGAVAASRAVDRSSCSVRRSVAASKVGTREREIGREREIEIGREKERDEIRPICNSSVAPKGIL